MSTGIGSLEHPQGHQREFFELLWISEEGQESIVERAQGVQILGVLWEVPEGSCECERIANFDDALDILRLFEVLLVGNFGECSKTDGLLHVHRRHLLKASEEMLAVR